jgi:hypothetical protein
MRMGKKIKVSYFAKAMILLVSISLLAAWLPGLAQASTPPQTICAGAELMAKFSQLLPANLAPIPPTTTAARKAPCKNKAYTAFTTTWKNGVETVTAGIGGPKRGRLVGLR